VLEEVDGNTVNQPLVAKVVERFVEVEDPAAWARELERQAGDLVPDAPSTVIYTILCGRIGNHIVRRFASARSWEVSLQLHMDLGADPERARRTGRTLRQTVATSLVKVPFDPAAPDCFLIARDLERSGVPVNFTSTFSARQVAAAALLVDATRTNVFMGRLNDGLEADVLGEHTTLEAQRTLRGLRRERDVKTRLIVASLRDWRTFPRVAGCDVFTAPCSVMAEYLSQGEIGASEVESQLETSYADALGVSDRVSEALGDEAIARLYRVEPEFVEFLCELRETHEYQGLQDGDRLFQRFDDAGFGDFFHDASSDDWKVAREDKLPDLDGPLTPKLALDTHFSLLADADFAKHQEAIDREIRARVGGDGD